MRSETRKLILHIPHSSTQIPIATGFTVNDKMLDKEILKLTDWYTEDIFKLEGSNRIVANFSRVFCDPERFSDDEKEVMSKKGMGVLYEKADDGKSIRDITQELRSLILNKYYWPHHEELNIAVESQLKEFKSALIIDCHSFPSTPFIRDLDQTPNRPDINIGTDSFHTPKYLIKESKKFFEERGFSVGIDWPYSGTIVPLKHFNKTKTVQSIMLEINRSLYLEEPSNKKSKNYTSIKNTTHDFLKEIRMSFETH